MSQGTCTDTHRVWNGVRRFSGRIAYTWLFKGPVTLRNRVPLISFSFDDFPRSAYEAGGAILKTYGFPTLVAMACGAYIVHMDKQAAAERAQASQERARLGQLLGAQMLNIQQDLEVIKVVCTAR